MDPTTSETPPRFAHHVILRKIGAGSYGTVFLARSKTRDEREKDKEREAQAKRREDDAVAAAAAAASLQQQEQPIPEVSPLTALGGELPTSSVSPAVAVSTGSSVGMGGAGLSASPQPLDCTSSGCTDGAASPSSSHGAPPLAPPVAVGASTPVKGLPPVAPLPIHPLSCPTPLGRSVSSSVASSSLTTPRGGQITHLVPLGAPIGGGVPGASTPRTPLVVINTRTNRTLRTPAGRSQSSEGEGGANTPKSAPVKHSAAAGGQNYLKAPGAVCASVSTSNLSGASNASFGSNSTCYSSGVPYTSSSSHLFRSPNTLHLDDVEGIVGEGGGGETEDEGADANRHVVGDPSEEEQGEYGEEEKEEHGAKKTAVKASSPQPPSQQTGEKKFKVTDVTPHLKLTDTTYDGATGHSHMDSVFTPMESRPSKSKFGHHLPGTTPRSPPMSTASHHSTASSVFVRRPSLPGSVKGPPAPLGASAASTPALLNGSSLSGKDKQPPASSSSSSIEATTTAAQQEQPQNQPEPPSDHHSEHQSQSHGDVEDDSAERKLRGIEQRLTGPLIPSLPPDVFGEDYEPAEVAIKVIEYYNDHNHPGRVQRIWQELAILHAAQGIPQVVPLYGIEEAVHPPDPVQALVAEPLPSESEKGEDNNAKGCSRHKTGGATAGSSQVGPNVGVAGNDHIADPQRDLHIRMAYVPFNLWRLITSGRLSRETEMIMPVVGQLLLGLSQLHEDLGVVHRDLSSGNVLVGNKLDTYICDFGFAKIAEDRMSQGVITQRYRAPEVILDCWYDHKVDVWAAGVMMVELFLQTSLFPAKQGDLEKQLVGILEVLGAIPEALLEDDRAFGTASALAKNYVRRKNKLNSIVRPKGIDGLSFKVKPSPMALDLMTNLLALNPHTRYSASQALHHPFFQSNKEFSSYVANAKEQEKANNNKDGGETSATAGGGGPGDTQAPPKLKLMGDDSELDYVQRVRSILEFYNQPPEQEEVEAEEGTKGENEGATEEDAPVSA